MKNKLITKTLGLFVVLLCQNSWSVDLNNDVRLISEAMRAPMHSRNFIVADYKLKTVQVDIASLPNCSQKTNISKALVTARQKINDRRLSFSSKNDILQDCGKVAIENIQILASQSRRPPVVRHPHHDRNRGHERRRDRGHTRHPNHNNNGKPQLSSKPRNSWESYYRHGYANNPSQAQFNEQCQWKRQQGMTIYGSEQRQMTLNGCQQGRVTYLREIGLLGDSNVSCWAWATNGGRDTQLSCQNNYGSRGRLTSVVYNCCVSRW